MLQYVTAETLTRNSASGRATPIIERAVISRRACGELEKRALLGPTRITAYFHALS